MSLDVAKRCIDNILSSTYVDDKRVMVSFIGGEPLLEFALIRTIYEYTISAKTDYTVHFFATTNGTVLSEDIKRWFSDHRDTFTLGLSLDGDRETHNKNRSGSFDRIDLSFFVQNWPNQGPKMTISTETLPHLFDNIMFIHKVGFKEIKGVNFAEGEAWNDDDSHLRLLSRELAKIVDYYSTHPELELDQLFGKKLQLCAAPKKNIKKTCGIGTTTQFYDIDGRKYPCSFVTPMTFSEEELSEINKTNFDDPQVFIDLDCLDNCHLYPICGTCSGGNYLANKTFAKRDRSKCRFMELVALYIAELHARRIINYRELYEDETELYYLIEAIKMINDEYGPKYEYLMQM